MNSKTLAFFLFLLFPISAIAETTCEANYRDTAAFCSGGGADGPNAVNVRGTADPYPQTDGSCDHGWETTWTDMNRDRDSGLCPKLAGFNQTSNDGANQIDYRFDLPEGAGQYCIRAALGDANNPKSDQYFQIRDTSSVLYTCDDTDGTNAAEFTDATCVTRTSASDWNTNNAENCLTFSTTIMRIRIGTPDNRGGESNPNTTLTHLSIRGVIASETGPTGGKLIFLKQ